MHGARQDWVKGQVAGLRNQFGWTNDGKISAWLAGCRLNAFGATTMQGHEVNAERQAALQRLSDRRSRVAKSSAACAGALQRKVSTEGSSVARSLKSTET